MSRRNVKVAVEGCGHGTLHAIYASVEESSRAKGWENGPDLVIIGGDFQAVRNANDLAAMSVPAKYREIGDFWEYYAGKRKAPYLTVFIGGNHEASNHMFELYYGGWVAPNIYYLGAANVIRFGGLRIAGLSGIWKGYNYRKPHHERLPYSPDDVKSIYHVRELDVRKLLQVQTQIDIGLSHDWPEGVEWLGNYQQLFRMKPLFKEDAEIGRLGSKAARYVLDQLRPLYWFSAHLHCKYAAVITHQSVQNQEGEHNVKTTEQPAMLLGGGVEKNEDEIDLDLDMDDDEDAPATGRDVSNSSKAPSTTPIEMHEPETNSVPEELRAQLPESFIKPVKDAGKPDTIPPGITNTKTQFLALDKCLPKRRFLQLLEIEPIGTEPTEAAKLSYDPEWLAITRATADELRLGDPDARVPPADLLSFSARIEAELAWVKENLVQKDLLAVPDNFEPTAPPYNEVLGIATVERPLEYTNPQTSAFCQMLAIKNSFDISEHERQERYSRPPPATEDRSGGFRGGRGGRGSNHRGRGRGFGRARGRGGFRAS